MENTLPAAPGTLDGRLAQLAQWLEVGGPVVAILLAMSVLALAIVLLKLYQFHAVRIGERRLPRRVLELYRGGHSQEALRLADNSPNPVAQLLALTLRGRQRELDEGRVREEVYRVGADCLERLRAYQRPLEVIASLAPLLGLLGTVMGMIKAFQQLQNAGARIDPAMLSGGIWEALLTTAVGLGVAIPVVALASFFERRVERLAHDMNDAVTQIFTVDLGRDAAIAAIQASADAGHDRAVAVSH